MGAVNILKERYRVENLACGVKQRERRDFQRDVAVSDGAFIRHRYDRAVATLGVEWPGVRHHLVPDAAAAAERIVQLTKALAQQPYKGAVRTLASPPPLPSLPHQGLPTRCPFRPFPCVKLQPSCSRERSSRQLTQTKTHQQTCSPGCLLEPEFVKAQADSGLCLIAHL